MNGRIYIIERKPPRCRNFVPFYGTVFSSESAARHELYCQQVKHDWDGTFRIATYIRPVAPPPEGQTAEQWRKEYESRYEQHLQWTDLSVEAYSASQNAALTHHLNNLLAVIHRDGGHYVAEHGLDRSVEDAMKLSSERIAEGERNAALTKERDQYKDELDITCLEREEYKLLHEERTKERDELRGVLGEICQEEDLALRVRPELGYCLSQGASKRMRDALDAGKDSRGFDSHPEQQCNRSKDEAVITKERDELRKENEGLRTLMEWINAIRDTYEIELGVHECSTDHVKQEIKYSCFGCSAVGLSKWPAWKIELTHDKNCKFVQLAALDAGKDGTALSEAQKGTK